MALWKQLVLTLLLVGTVLAAWGIYVPSSQPWLDKVGLLQPMRRVGLIPEVAQDPNPSGAVNGSRGGPAVVFAALPEQVIFNDVISAIGSARSARSVTVQTEVEGQLAKLHVRPGETVVAGQVIAELDSAAAQIALDRSALILADAEATWDRVEQLQLRGATTDLQVQDADLARKTAILLYREAEYELSRHRIVAPIGGSIGLLVSETGDRLSKGADVTGIEDRSSLIVDFRVPERVVARLNVGDPVQAVALADPERMLSGRILALDNRVDETSRTLMVQAAFGNQNDRLRAGMAFSISLTFTGASYPAVDPLAIQWGSDGSFVWVVREGKAVSLPIQIVQRNSANVLIKATLQPDDLVVIEGVQGLRPGAEVTVASGDKTAAQIASPEQG